MSIVVALNLPEHGHMNATYPVIAELVRRGERVIYYATEPYRGRIEGAGAEYRSYGDPALFQPPAHKGGLYSVMAWEIELAERILPSLLAELRELSPDYLLIDSMCVWGQLISRILQIPAVMMASVFVPDDRIITSDDLVRQGYGSAPKEVILAGIDALNTYLGISQRLDRQYGTECPNIAQFFAGRQNLNIVFTSRYFHLDGERFDESYQFVGPTLKASQPPREGQPLVYIAMGTVFNDLPDFYRLCYEALGGGPYAVVLAAGSKTDRSALGPAPANFAVFDSVVQVEVLRRASLFISHAGMNSVNEALWNETPMLLFPQHGDQHLVAARVEQLGAGIVLRPGDLEPSRLRSAVENAIKDSRLREGARRVAESFRTAGGYRRAADEIMRWRCQASA